MNYNIVYTKLMNLPHDVPLRQAGKDPNGSKEYISKPYRRDKTLREIFEVPESDMELFLSAFEYVGNGKGKESGRITTVHSSSLLGLLTFFRVPNKPICIRGIDGVTFDKVYFEVESTVFKINGLDSNSSVDVLLVSDDENTLLFLELKFTEFLSPSNYYWLEPKYLEIYNSLSSILEEADILVGPIEKREHTPRNKDKEPYTTSEFKIASSSNSKHYFGGIKQMISHAIGLIKSPLSGNTELQEKYIIGKNPRIILGTMLFNPSAFDETAKAAYKDYTRLYENVFSQSSLIKEQLMKLDGIERDIEIIESPLTYQEDVTGVDGLNPYLAKVKEIYNL